MGSKSTMRSSRAQKRKISGNSEYQACRYHRLKRLCQKSGYHQFFSCWFVCFRGSSVIPRKIYDPRNHTNYHEEGQFFLTQPLQPLVSEPIALTKPAIKNQNSKIENP